MKNVTSSLLPFKLTVTKDKITANAGLVLLGEFIHSLRFWHLIDKEMRASKSSHRYLHSSFIAPLVLMLNGGGRYIEDVREIAADEALLDLIQIRHVPSTSAIGDWLRSIAKDKVAFSGIARCNNALNKKALKITKKKEFTLDIDASQIIAWKTLAKFTYKGEKGYMPMLGHVAETGMVINEEFREGNISPFTRNLAFIKQCCAKMPKGKRFSRLRADSASYQANIFNWCENNKVKFAIGGHMDEAVKTIIKELKEDQWEAYQGSSSITRVAHCMQKTDKAFDLIIIRRPYQLELFNENPDECNRYTLVATNIKGKPESIVRWYNQRGEASENRIKELKIGFAMEYMPCGTTKANAVYFRIGILAYNMFRLFKMASLPENWAKHTVQTIRWKFYRTAGKLISHAGRMCLKIKEACYNFFEEVRARIKEFATNAV